MDLLKKMKKNSVGCLVVLLVVGYGLSLLFKHLNSKGLSGFESNSGMQTQHKNAEASATVKPSNPDGNEDFAAVSGAASTQPPNGASCSASVQNPGELLPQDGNSQWSDLNPAGKGELSNINLLSAGHHIGTVSQSLRNANLQIRAEPANPQIEVGPWNNTTMQADEVKYGLNIC